MENKLECVVKPAIHLTFSDCGRRETRVSGCQAFDVEFKSPLPDSILTISFQNFYTHSLSLLFCQSRDLNSKSDSVKWIVAIKNIKLMSNCHCERGSQGLVILNKAQFEVPLENVSKLKFILRQPSPDWHQFGIRDLEIYSVPIPYHQLDMGMRPGLSSSRMEQILQNGLVTDTNGYHTPPHPYNILLNPKHN